MLRPLLTLTCVATIAASLPAQEKPTADQQHAVAGTWKFDQSRSDTVSSGALSGLRGSVGLGRRSGGSGGGGGSSGGGAARVAAAAVDAAVAAVAGAVGAVVVAAALLRP